MSNADEIYDEWLVLRCQGGDSAALAILVQRWQPRLIGLAVRVLGERDLADDVVQSAWVDIVKRINSLNDPKAIRPWLFRIVANKCADVIRKRSRRRQTESAADLEQVADPNWQKRSNREQRSDQVTQLRRVIKTLDDTHHDVLRMHYLEQLSIDFIAERLSIPVGTVKSRLYHARQKLKQTLGANHERSR